jgi:uncharacterized protein YbjT (DUF2867 family)
MKILLTGANGYIGKRLLPVLLEHNHEVICCVRDTQRFHSPTDHPGIKLLQIDFLKEEDNPGFPENIDVAFYLIHSMSANIDNFEALEIQSAKMFSRLISKTSAKQIIYLSGIDNNPELSKHLKSRKMVENELRKFHVPLTVLKAGIIVGSGSASFEIIRDLVEKLPVMITPRWLNSLCQPIAIRNVIDYLTGVMLHPETYGKSFEIGGPEILTYKEMLMQYAGERKLRRWIFTLPVMTPRLSSYWLFFITSTSYKLAVNLVNSMKIDVTCKEDRIRQILPIHLISYREAIQRAFGKIEQNLILSSWKDALISSSSEPNLQKYMQVPSFGCYKDRRKIIITGNVEDVLNRLWSIGGKNGWFYANSLWKIRGYIDKIAGGTGLRRGRTSPDEINAGDALDFWRVLLADKARKRLLLYAELKLPGEAWLEFRIEHQNAYWCLFQEATFRPRGIAGRFYWYSVLPFHHFIFEGMARRIASGSK